MTGEQEFRQQADEALTSLYKTLAEASETDNYEVDLNHGNVTIEFEEPPAKFVVSPNTPARQIWVSAHSKSFKLDYDDVQHTFVLKETGQTLMSLIRQAVAKQLGGGDMSF